MTQWGLDSLFNPAKRHMDEEKRRLQSTREEIGDSSGGKRIDLASGKVIIQRNTDADTSDAPDADPKLDKDDAGDAKPMTAAERARLRHRNRRASKPE